MGQSTDAIFFYGYCWNEEAELWDKDRYDEWYEAAAKRRDIPSPWDFYRDSGAETEHGLLPYKDQTAAYEAWKDAVGFESMLAGWDAAKDSIKAEHPHINVGSHCSCDCPMPYICIVGTEQRAWRGRPTTFDPAMMVLDQDNTNWDGWLANFVEALDIDVTDAQGPGWFLVSNWC